MNKQRRKLLKLIAFGGGTFFAGKVFGDSWKHLSAEKGKEVYFKNFKVLENEKELGVYESSGEPILVIDKESF